MPLDIVIIVVICVIAIFPLGVGQFLVKWVFRGIYLLFLCPYHLVLWFIKRRKAKRRRINYELLGNYVAVLGDNPTVIAYFKGLIKDGIAPRKLQQMLEMNVVQLKKLEYDKNVTEILDEIQQKSNIQVITAEQEEILQRSKANLEKIRFQEKALDGLYRKIQKKYGV